MAAGDDRSRAGRSGPLAALGRAAAALAAALVALAAVEGALRLTRLGAPPPGRESGLAYQHVFLPVMEPATLSDGSDVWRTVDPRHAWDVVARPKPAGTFRVFVLGGSAAAGLGYSPNAAFAAFLEELLGADGADAVEVVNLGTVALPSAGVATMAADLLGYAEPDLLVVYSGNNEFLELHSRRYFEATASRAARMRAALGRSRIARVARSLGGGGAARPRVDSRALAAGDARVDHRAMMSVVRVSERDRLAVEVAYEANLDRLARAASAAGVPLLLVGVAANERWWGMEDFDPSDATPPPSPAHAEHRRRYGEALAAEAAGDLAGAARRFREALDADPHLRRATPRLAARAREVAERTAGVQYVDAPAALAARAPGGIVGFETFYDYVHFTPRGALALAEEVAKAVVAQGLQPRPSAQHVARVRRDLDARLAASEDSFDVTEWLGFSDDPARLADRDLWKYDRMLDELDRRIEADPADWKALAWRGNAVWFDASGAGRAREDWSAASRASSPDTPAALRLNLERHAGGIHAGEGVMRVYPRE